MESFRSLDGPVDGRTALQLTANGVKVPTGRQMSAEISKCYRLLRN